MVKLADIKTKQKSNIKIKKFNKAQVYTQKLKNNIVNVKEKSDYTSNNNEESTPTEYGANQITEKTNILAHRSANKFNEYGKKSVRETKENIEKTTQKIKKKIQNRNIKRTIKTIKGKENVILKENTKNMKQTIKNTPKTVKKTLKGTQRVTKETVKGAKKSYQIAKATAKVTVKSIKVGIKATISAIKAIILAMKGIIAFLIAGGWIAVIIIIIICLIAMLVSSVFGIFFSSEDTGSTITVNGTQQVVTMNQVISDLNTEFMNKITQIQQETSHDEYDITGQRTEWKDILAIYSVKISEGKNETDVITLNDEKVQILKNIFWQMNEVTSNTEQVTKTIETTDSNGNTVSQTTTITMLHITINNKSIEEMSNQYSFSTEQKSQLTELTSEEYASMWSAVIYGYSAGSNDIVKVALEQVGNVGGQPYWSWYGFISRVEWCACFVSWCAEQCGYIDAGIIPKFASCQSEGVAWFKTCGLWEERGYIPKARRYNIF